jgi:hypothetical protein
VSGAAGLRGVYFTDLNNGWVVGGGGTVLHTTNGGTTFIEDERDDYSQPQGYVLYQNYPNPFNPTTMISYQLPVSSDVTLKVYDVLGNEIAALVNGYRPLGIYEIEFNTIDLPSGIYFYQLRAGSFIETKKMVFIK